MAVPMSLRRKACLVLAVLAGAYRAEAAPLDSIPETPSLTNVRRQGWVQFSVRSGRIVVAGLRGVNFNHSGQLTAERRERLTIRVSANEPILAYELTTPAFRFQLDVAAGNRVQIRRLPGENRPGPPVEFRQSPNEPLALKIGGQDDERVYHAASIWHLLLAEPAAGREHLDPLLRILFREWDFTKTAEEIEAALVRMAQSGAPPDQKRWAQWVQELGHASFAKREAADRNLRESGRVVASYLQRLDPASLDAEQRFRVRRILRALAEVGNEESPPQLAMWLSGDTSVWLALLAREDEPTRRAALQRLEALVGHPLAFDPAAGPQDRKRQLEALRAALGEKPAGGDKKP